MEERASLECVTYSVTRCVVYFDQLSGAAHTQKLVKLLFSAVLTFFVHFKPFSAKNEKIPLYMS